MYSNLNYFYAERRVGISIVRCERSSADRDSED
jgi:hypothetical protein